MGGFIRKGAGLCLILLGLPAAGWAVWEDVGPLVSEASYDAQAPSIADNPSGFLTPYVAFSQHNGSNYRIIGKSYYTSWQLMGTPLNITLTADAFTPDVALDMSGSPYVTWLENGPLYRVWLKRYAGGVWTPIGGAANYYGFAAKAPRLAIDNLTPYVAWVESDGTTQHAVVAHYNSGWIYDSPSLNRFPNENASSADIQIAISGSPVVTWSETLGGAGSQIYVRRYNGLAFESFPGAVSLNIDTLHNARHPRLAVDGDTPYVTWEEENGVNREVYVKYHNGTDWELISPPLNVSPTQDAFSPDIALLPGPVPIVAWCEFDGTTTQVYAKQFQTSAIWEPLDVSLNVNINRGSFNPDIAVIDGDAYVVWEEFISGLARVIYCRRWRTPTPTFTPTPTITPTPSRTSTLTPTLSATVTRSPSATVSRTATLSPTVTVTLTPLNTFTFTPTPSRTPTPSQTGTITVSPTRSLTSTQSPTRTRTLTLTTTGTITRTMTVTPFFTPTFTPVVTPGTTTATATATPIATSTRRVVMPGRAQPVVIRGNVYRPTQQPPLTIAVFLDEPQQIKIQVFTLRGKLVKTVADQTASAGTFEAVWNGANREGQIVRSGVYIVNVETRQFREKRRVVVVR